MAGETRTIGRCPVSSDAARGARIAALLPLGLVLAWPEAAVAYVGPGAGITMLGALGAVILAILFALGGLIWWPIRAMRQRRKRATGVGATDHAQGD